MRISFEGCARCDGSGHDLDFKAFIRPVTAGDIVFSHWALCPETREPILLVIYDEDEDADSPAGE